MQHVLGFEKIIESIYNKHLSCVSLLKLYDSKFPAIKLRLP